MDLTYRRLSNSAHRALAFLVLIVIVFGHIPPVSAQGDRRVQVVRGYLAPDGVVFITISNLLPLQRLYIYVEGTSGNLDPFAALVDEDFDGIKVRESFNQQVQEALKVGGDPIEVVPQIANSFFLTWDDDTGTGYDAALDYVIPAAGDYQLVLLGSPFNPGSGDYKVTVGIDAPDVLAGNANPTGDRFATIQNNAQLSPPNIQEVGGELKDTRSAFHVVNDLRAGDTLYAYVETSAGDLAPILTLEDFGGKALASGNFDGSAKRANLAKTFKEEARNYRIRVTRGQDSQGKLTSGDYRLQIGINAPEVRDGKGVITSNSIVLEPIDVKVGVQMDQITGVDQKAENFGVAASLRMEWTDPSYAFSPDECNCEFKTFNDGAFDSFISASGLTWPEFILFNQQGRRDTQSQVVVVQPDGKTIYFERFSVTLQAPDFDFKLFPFDTQKFFIRVESVFPESFYKYSELPAYTGIGEQLGEEEWIVRNVWTEIVTAAGNARYSFGFEANRHLIFYIVRIFTPILVIIIVSWFTFFLNDYGKRVDVASANLLLFIAFNFTISGELPRLGYLTFMDVVLVSTFVVTALVVVFNVWLKRLEVNKKESVAQTIDKYSIWIYPILYIGAIVSVAFLFS